MVERIDEARFSDLGPRGPARMTGALDGYAPLLGTSAAMRELLDRADAVATTDAPVVLLGESGTGKELVARRIHARSSRRDGPFVAVNCAAFPDTLIEEELFGHQRGAFTGAVKEREGRFKTAQGGTLFLDELAELSAQAQAKLLRVLQSFSFEPVGSDTTVHVNVRVISATHRDLREAIVAGRFREDLYYRIKVVELRLPPLRAREEDLELLIGHFLAEHAASVPGRSPPRLTPRARAALIRYNWPGNVRELQHAIAHAVVLARGGDLDLPHLPDDVTGAPLGAATRGLEPLGVAMKAFEREYLVKILRHTSGARARAAALLGISRKTLWEKLREHGIDADDTERR
jgi:DNA-binding NtrC family response regulator